MRKELLILSGAVLILALASCSEETKIEYIDRVVEVEKPVEVIKEVEVVKEVPIEVEKIVYVDRPVEVEKIVEKEVKVDVPVEKIVEVEKPVYVERSQVDLTGMNVVKLDDNLYEFEIDLGSMYSGYSSSYQNNYYKDNLISGLENDIDNELRSIKECKQKGYLNIIEEKELHLQDLYKIKSFKTLFNLDNVLVDGNRFKRGQLISKPGYVIKDIMLINPRKMATPTLLDNEYNGVECSNIDFTQYKAGVVAVKYEYNNVNKEQIHISFNKSEKGVKEFYGAEVVRVIFSVRK